MSEKIKKKKKTESDFIITVFLCLLENQGFLVFK